MKGFPRRGSDGLGESTPRGAVEASMKGFPRRGSDLTVVCPDPCRYGAPQ